VGRSQEILSKSRVQGDYILIFVTVGTQKFQFDRLFRELDKLIEKGIIDEEVIAQSGYTTYSPKYYTHFKLINEEEMNHYLEKASLIITHSGTSSIIGALKKGKKVVVVPRMSQYGEHVDDHQLEIARVFEAKNVVEVAYDINDLNKKLNVCKDKVYSTIELDNSRLLNSVKEFIHDLERY
jgi:UDP-N-acetylglucosamine transferase subunit ALG13